MPAQLAIDLAGGVDAARVTLDSLRVARSATSLGGPETLVCHPATSTHVSLLPEDQAAIGITDGLLRISVGLEEPADIIADLCQAIPLIRSQPKVADGALNRPRDPVRRPPSGRTERATVTPSA